MRSLFPLVSLAGVVASTVALSACQAPSSPPLDTEADSLAFRVAEGAGGLDAWEALPGLSWEWSIVRDSVEMTRRRHVWDKRRDRARVEWARTPDTIYVAVLQPSAFDSTKGQVALNGTVLTGPEAASLLTEANGRFINDAYWLLAPLKVFDPGVLRAVDRETGADRLALSFERVGLTPGDRYWIEVEPVTGSMTGWSYMLESGNEGAWSWTDPTTLDTPRGPLSLARIKTSADGQTLIYTDPTALSEIDETEFTDLHPRLHLNG